LFNLRTIPKFSVATPPNGLVGNDIRAIVQNGTDTYIIGGLISLYLHNIFLSIVHFVFITGLFTIGGNKNLAIYNRVSNSFSSYLNFPDTNAVTELAISFDNSKLFVATSTVVRLWNGASWTM